MLNEKIKIQTIDLLNLVHWARRYCDGRGTFAPTSFNRIYQNILSLNPNLNDHFDETLMEDGKYFPYAQDAMYDEKTGAFDARPVCDKL